MEHPPFEDVFPIEHRGFSWIFQPHVSFSAGGRGFWMAKRLQRR